jgi:hypothetical protein
MKKLEQELPEAIKNVDIDEWLYAPGYPESAPALSSSLFDDVKARIDAYESGALPASNQVADWIPDQIRLFLLMLPERIPVEDCRQLERIFNLKDTHNYFMMNRFYQIAVQSGYQEVLPGIERAPWLKKNGPGMRRDRCLNGIVISITLQP